MWRMRRNEAIAALQGQTEAIKALGATSLYLFGSTERDEAGGASDVDLFIDYDPDSLFSLVDLVGIQQFLEQCTGVPVDLTTRDSLDPFLRGDIEASALRIF
jgi:predicted nucleotidyltransferase